MHVSDTPTNPSGGISHKRPTENRCVSITRRTPGSLFNFSNMDIVFSFDGSTIPSGIGNTRKLWNVNSLEDVLYATPSPLFCLLAYLTSLRFSRFNSSSNPLILTFTFSSPFIFSKTRISEATSRIFFPFRIDSNSFNRSGGDDDDDDDDDDGFTGTFDKPMNFMV